MKKLRRSQLYARADNLCVELHQYIDEISQRAGVIITPKKVWILLGEWEGAEGCEVIAVFKHNPTKKQQRKVEKREFIRRHGRGADPNDERFSTNVVSCEIEP